jgi:hypothetical protein
LRSRRSEITMNPTKPNTVLIPANFMMFKIAAL